ncbi:4-oxalocrotonate tautomerase [Nitrospirillum viridazoti CBAmc]|uniref:4-oxalocrotonate tautomerase n=1 Tax=Nitrospirillum viridazoti CBAmc TaxID=1441467 RepID=A0A248K071_9PROT|nr:4-oxalocrotonate tautomerase [Nitrospirillum amazonense CBAmc]
MPELAKNLPDPPRSNGSQFGWARKKEPVHRTTALLIEYFSEASRPHATVLIEEVEDGGYARADEMFVIPDQYRAEDWPLRRHHAAKR